MTDTIEANALDYIRRLDEMGGMLNAIEEGFPQREISEASYIFQQQLDKGERVMVGLNRYQDDGQDVTPIPVLKIGPEIERDQVQRIKAFKSHRSASTVAAQLVQVRACCQDGTNLMPALIDAVDQGVTLGEICDIYREVFGIYTDPGLI